MHNWLKATNCTDYSIKEVLLFGVSYTSIIYEAKRLNLSHLLFGNLHNANFFLVLEKNAGYLCKIYTNCVFLLIPTESYVRKTNLNNRQGIPLLEIPPSLIVDPERSIEAAALSIKKDASLTPMCRNQHHYETDLLHQIKSLPCSFGENQKSNY